PRVAREARGEEVHEALEGALLAGAVVGPERLEARRAVLLVAVAEEILQASGLEGVALHVEEHVARVGRRHAVESAPAVGVGLEELVPGFPGLAAVDLQACLSLQTNEGFGNYLVRLELRKSEKRANAFPLEPLD